MSTKLAAAALDFEKQELAREAAVLRRALETAQAELRHLRADAGSSGLKKKGSRRRWFTRRRSSSPRKKRAAVAAAGALSAAASGSGQVPMGGSAGAGVAAPSPRGLNTRPSFVSSSGAALHAVGEGVLDVTAPRYSRAVFKQLRSALLAPTALSCASPLAVPSILVRIFTWLPFHEVRTAWRALQRPRCVGHFILLACAPMNPIHHRSSVRQSFAVVGAFCWSVGTCCFGVRLPDSA